MFLARVFARSRVWKPLVLLCAVCALAFTLGQGVAAVQLNLTQAPVPSAAARQINLPVSGAQGTPTATANRPAPASSVSSKEAPGSQTRPLTANAGSNGKAKHHPKHLKAAGDKSHGGLHHKDGSKSGNGQSDHNGQDAQGSGNDHGNQNGAQGGN